MLFKGLTDMPVSVAPHITVPAHRASTERYHTKPLHIDAPEQYVTFVFKYRPAGACSITSAGRNF